MRVGIEPVDGRLPTTRDAVDGAGADAGVDQPPLLGRRVKQRPTGQSRELGHDAVGAPVRHAGHDEMIDGDDRRDAGHERPLLREPRAHAAHADLVAAIAHADGDGLARPRPRGSVPTRGAHAPVAPAEHLVERAVPVGDRDAARVEIVPGAAAAGTLDGDEVRRALASEDGPGGAGAVGMRQHLGGLAERAQRVAQDRQHHGIGRVAHSRAEAAQGATEHDGARRPVGLRHALGDDEAGDDQHGPRAHERAGGTQRAARLEEGGDAAPAGIQREQVIDRIEETPGGGHGSGRYHRRDGVCNEVACRLWPVLCSISTAGPDANAWRGPGGRFEAVMNRRALLPLSLLLAATGCAHAPMVVKHTYDFRTTALFKLPCDEVRKPDALAAGGMSVSPPPLQTPADVRAYTDFMGSHYAEEYYERDLRSITDRFCVNSRDSHDMGDDRTFAIVWRNGHVYKRVIKGGPIDNPKQEKGFLICPSTFIVDTVTGGLSTAARGMAGVK